MGNHNSRPSNSVAAGATASISTSAGPIKEVIPVSGVEGTTVAKTWVGNSHENLCFPELDDPDFAVPALNDKAPLAICISGGGMRATTLGLGWLRGLHQIDVLDKAKYLCVCSGSSWLGAALSFQQECDVAEFLGLYLPPDQCSLEALKQVGTRNRSYAAAIADGTPLRDYFRGQFKRLLGGKLLNDKKELEKEARAWTRAMSGAFLEPFGLGDTDSSTVTMAGTQGGVHVSVSERASQVGRGTVYTASNPDLPFPIICQVVLLPKDEALYYPFEWTPLYGGCPVSYPGTQPKLGGGWVETLGLNAQLVEKPQEEVTPGGSALVRVRPRGPASLGEAIGISSAYNSLVWALGKNEKEEAMHKALGFHTTHYFDTQDWSNSVVAASDGGGTDLHSVYPALRRRVPNILTLSATNLSLDDPNFARDMKDLPAFFGCWPGNPKEKGLSTEALNQQRQVFRAEGYAELLAALMARKRAGLPTVHLAEYEVLDNPAMGVRGGWRVRVLWVINEEQAQWEAALPKATRDKIQHHRKSKLVKVRESLNPFDADTLREFPMVSTFAMDYTPELVGLMANHAAWMLVQSKDLILQLLEAPSAAAAAMDRNCDSAAAGPPAVALSPPKAAVESPAAAAAVVAEAVAVA